MKQRVISTGSLLLASVSAIIGSGWLFAAYYAGTITGPSSLVAWLIGSVAMIIVAFVFAELSAFVPITGASIRVPHYTHGQFVSFIFAWVIWVTYFSCMSVEVQAIIQYGSFFYPNLVYTNGGLTHAGYTAATGLMLLVSIINFYSLKWLLHCNNFLTILKIIIPLVIVIAILIAQFPISHDTVSKMTFAPLGMKGILSALTTSGIIFSFNGFRQATEMAGEAKNPQRALPIAVIGSILICMVVYIALQYSFLASVATDEHLKNWQLLKFSGTNSPFAVILSQEKLSALLPVLYLGAVIGPFAAALMYCSSGARALYAMSLNGSLPKICARLNAKNLPIVAIPINFVFGMLLFAPFPGWASMASFLTSLMVLTYIVAPVSLLSLRKHMGNQKRYFQLPFASFWGFLAFYICSLLIYWTGWAVLVKLFFALLLGFLIMMVYRLFTCRQTLFQLDWKASSWVWFFFTGMAIISYCGSFGGGKGYLSFGYDFFAVAVLSVISVYLSLYCSRSTSEITQDITALLES